MRDAGSYKILSRLGEGGMAEIYKVLKKGPDGFEKIFALKKVLPHLSDNRSMIQMLSQEARLMAMLDHPNIIHVIDFFVHDETFYLVLEYVEGINLRNILADSRKRNRRLSWQAIVHIASETLKGLDYAHHKVGRSGPLKIIHRDVSPQNILISKDGWVKLSDFGIAKANMMREETKTGLVKGKVGYFAPEFLTSDPVDHRSDLFSIGVVLYEALSGTHPFRVQNDYETMKNIAEGRWLRLRERNPHLPSKLLKTVDKVLSKDPEARHQHAIELRSELLATQDPKWLVEGNSRLQEELELLYPNGMPTDETPIEETLVLSKIASQNSHQRPFLLALLLCVSLLPFFQKWFEQEETLNVTPMRQMPVTPPASVKMRTTLRPKTIKNRGKLQIVGSEGSEVYLNGQRIGRLPLGPVPLAPGKYNVLIAKDGFSPMMTRAEIVPNEIKTIEWNKSSSSK